jgi:hypothetical protein
MEGGKADIRVCDGGTVRAAGLWRPPRQATRCLSEAGPFITPYVG